MAPSYRRQRRPPIWPLALTLLAAASAAASVPLSTIDTSAASRSALAHRETANATAPLAGASVVASVDFFGNSTAVLGLDAVAELPVEATTRSALSNELDEVSRTTSTSRTTSRSRTTTARATETDRAERTTRPARTATAEEGRSSGTASRARTTTARSTRISRSAEASNSSLPLTSSHATYRNRTTTASATVSLNATVTATIPNNSTSLDISTATRTTISPLRPTSRGSASTTTSTTRRRTTTTVERTTTRTRTSTRTARPSTSNRVAVVTSTRGSASRMHSATARPSPTRYGGAPTAGCVEPPDEFAGTDAGFAQLCSVRYCDAKPRRNMVWDGIDGDVTRTEIETALGMLRELEPLWENGQGNVLADGWLGQGMHDAGLLYEITGDIRAMDIMVQIADNIISLQNANTAGGGVRIWTGAKDSVWPTGDLKPEDGKLVYAGCEQGLIVGNMVAAAVYILKSPCLWDLIPPEFDGPTVFDRTTTYKQRALAYIAAGDDTYRFFLWRFLDQRLNIINPPDARWDLTGDTRKAGTPMPWNRGMMIMYGYLKLAAAHETPDLWEPDTTAYYDTIAKQHITNFIDDLEHSTAVRNGVKTYDWNYSYGEDHTEEAQGVHAYFDIWGCWQTWQRNSAVFGVSNEVGTTFANTFEETISLGNGSFSGLVTGHSTTKSYMINRLYGGWGFYALWRRDWFDTLVVANTAVSFSGRTWLAIPLLWTKHALFLNDMTFWSGRSAHGYGVAVGTTGGDGTTSTTWGARSGAGNLASYPACALGVTLVAAAALFTDLA